MISIDFNSGGQVRVFTDDGDASLSVRADANRLPGLVPEATLARLRELMAEFLDLTQQAPKLKAVNPRA